MSDNVVALSQSDDPEGPFASSEVLARVDARPYEYLRSEPGRALIWISYQQNLHYQLNGYEAQIVP